jgi:hypothetical protein
MNNADFIAQQHHAYRTHISTTADSMEQLRATDVDRLVIELPKAFASASFLRWLLTHDDLSKRARAEATALLAFAEH